MTTTSITLDHVGLDLPIFDVSGQSLKKRVLRAGRRNRIAEDNDGVVIVRALDDISFSLEAGDRLGLIGANGAGKSTLLRVMAGIYPPTAGSVRTQGKAVPLLDIALGMDDHSTGRQNIRLRGLLLGMSDAEIRAKSEEIAAFTELGDYLDLPLRTYSTGMRVRLGFAISTAVDAQILLLDEVLGVGTVGSLHGRRTLPGQGQDPPGRLAPPRRNRGDRAAFQRGDPQSLQQGDVAGSRQTDGDGQHRRSHRGLRGACGAGVARPCCVSRAMDAPDLRRSSAAINPSPPGEGLGRGDGA
jgi:ABC-type polysaccharide/polyol phosphate transport system ATPase subunit